VVPPWHVQFLAAVGVPAWRADWDQEGSDLKQLIREQLRLICKLSQATQGLGLVQQRLIEDLLPARETLLLLLEVVLLHPGLPTLMFCHSRMAHIWNSIQRCAANARETAATMLQPLLHLLGPAVLQQLEDASSGSSSSSSRDDADFDNRPEDFAGGFAMMTEWLVGAGAMRLRPAN
jgi:hypothetical protein